MKRFVAIALLLFGSYSLFAQQWEFDYMGSLNVVSGLIAPNGNMVSYGWQLDEYQSNRYCCAPFVFQVSEDGTYSQHCYWDLYPGMFYDMVPLDDGNFFAAGLTCDTVNLLYDAFLIALFDSEMNLIAANRFDLNPFFNKINSVTAEKDSDGTIVMLGDCYSPSKTEYRPCFFRFNQNGELLDYRWVTTTTGPERYFGSYQTRQLKCHPSNGNLAILCNWRAGGLGIFVYDHDFNYVSAGRYEDNFDIMYDNETSSDLWLSDEELLAWTERRGSQDNVGQIHLAIAQLNVDATSSRFEIVCHRQDTTEQTYNAPGLGMAYSNDSTIYGIYLSYRYLGGEVQTGICLFNRDMEVLSCLLLDGEYYDYHPYMIFHQEDGGCIVFISQPGHSHLKILKFSREDFNPIPCSVKDVPKEAINASAFPNPASDEIHFDISGLPIGKEHRISISDAMGRTVMSRIIRGEGNVLTIGFSGFMSGIYTYQIYNAEKEIVGGKFVKE